MKKILNLILCLSSLSLTAQAAEGWPQNYGGVMLQAFYWDSFDDTNWTILESQAAELGQYFDLVWLPQSANCGGTSMGYDDLYWFSNYNSSFGSEAELRSLIKAFKANGIGTIADVVINHRKTLTGKNFDFPVETYKGVTYQMGAADVVKADGGSGNADTGENWNGMPDLDHKSENVQKCVKAYLDLLLNDLGYVGFRYDMVKGYAGSYTKLYNESANPTYSVGECWDGTGTIRNWIDATSKTSAAFDFQFRYTVRNAANNGQWNKLAQRNDNNWPLISSSYMNGDYRRYAVTFVENHDTEKRSNAVQDPLKKDTLAANAYMLAMPGTPCVFLTHWIDCKQAIKAMIDVRKLVGIHNQSTYTNKIVNTAISSVAAYETVGTNGSLLVVVGNQKDYETAENQWVRVLSGYHYSYYLPTTMNTAWVDLASGNYTSEQKATLTAVSSDANAKIVYTTDGSTPTASSKQATSGTTISLPVGTDMTLKVGLLTGGKVLNVITRKYVVKEEQIEEFTIPACCTRSADEICAFFEAPVTWTSTIKCWAWTNSPSDNFTGGSWPGVECQQVGVANNGCKVWKWTWNGKKQNNSSAKQPQGIIFSNNGTPQTGDLDFVNGGYYTNKEGLRGTVSTGIDLVISEKTPTDFKVYTIDGRLVRTATNQAEALSGLGKGLYIINNKKTIIK